MINSEFQKIINLYLPNLKGESLNSVINHSSLFNSNKGSQLISEGKKHNYFYIILNGAVKCYYSKDSREICTWFAFEKDVIGTISTYEGLPSKETIELLEDSEFIRFNLEQLKELSKSNLQIIHILNNTINIPEQFTRFNFIYIQGQLFITLVFRLCTHFVKH